MQMQCLSDNFFFPVVWENKKWAKNMIYGTVYINTLYIKYTNKIK